jgi:DNA-binding NarL/FixJ family response regulator
VPQQASAAVRIHLADDHTMFREGLVAILASQQGLEVVGQSSTGQEAAALIRETNPDVVITQLDTRLKTAEQILSGIRSASPDSRIVVLTMFDNLHYMKAISEMGIDAYLHKSSSAEELRAIIDTLVHNPSEKNAVVALPRSMLQRLEGAPENALTERETEVVVLAARGLSNRQIARELNISEGTTKRHLANIYQKVEVRSRSEVVRKALQEEWIGLHEITSERDGTPLPQG